MLLLMFLRESVLHAAIEFAWHTGSMQQAHGSQKSYIVVGAISLELFIMFCP